MMRIDSFMLWGLQSQIPGFGHPPAGWPGQPGRPAGQSGKYFNPSRTVRTTRGRCAPQPAHNKMFFFCYFWRPGFTMISRCISHACLMLFPVFLMLSLCSARAFLMFPSCCHAFLLLLLCFVYAFVCFAERFPHASYAFLMLSLCFSYALLMPFLCFSCVFPLPS